MSEIQFENPSAALRVYTERGFPPIWAMTRGNLGLAYSDLPTGDRSGNLKRAIVCFHAVIRGFEAVGAINEVRTLAAHLALVQ